MKQKIKTKVEPIEKTNNIIENDKNNNIIINDNNPKNNISPEEKEEVKKKEEEKNIFSYRQLIAEKCHDIIKLENEKKNENLVVNNIKTIKEDKEQTQEKEEENIVTQNIKIENEDKRRSKTINTNKTKEFSNTKEGTLKILQLIKAKKNEKNLIEKKLKETQNNIKEDKVEPIEKTNNIIENDKNNNIIINDNNPLLMTTISLMIIIIKIILKIKI